jgi:succinoglycan biosynthesis protein ExoW
LILLAARLQSSFPITRRSQASSGAVLSAIAQEGVGDLEIIVVDDGSPAPARDDLQGIKLPAHVTLKLIEQPNRGPGAARNRGLDSVSSNTVYVALLDSDDRWTKSHLYNAHSILESGFDIYFADLRYSRFAETFFSRMGLNPARHVCIDSENMYYELRSKVRCQALNSLNPFPASCVVYRWQKFRNLRYHEIAFMGEDLTFWMQMASQTDRIAFRSSVECFSGEGVHIYENSGWGTPRAVWRVYNYIKWRKWLHHNIVQTERERQDNLRELEKLRRSFIAVLLHEIRKARAFRNLDIVRVFLLDPKVAFHLIPVTTRVVLDKLRLRNCRSDRVHGE